ncbi:2-isopropylmalate synthase [Halarsenatibacter silvermanii]|uniref:2-isopropylmalate synthase n=1 Tax=Halarsenatibacter silvermanii TaxID=321763 RepID=A0A1G9QU65_9FIRM|nr:2-isopropylmalate synthase [Halarsenatibacter silvermanii]SDM14137.1 2-isopropylmalate synthase [Halarsenatibacter silvermanii]
MTVKFFDTTLRDGEQSPGVNLNIKDKLRIAEQLAALNVDVIEAGFPISSEGDFRAVNKIAEEVSGPIIAGLARTKKEDIDRAWEAIKPASRPRIHTFIATSQIHMEHKLRKSPEEVLEESVRAVERAKSYTDDVEFSAEDAVRSDRDFLCELFEAVIEAGATTVNIPDTVGYSVPHEFGGLVAYIRENVSNISEADMSIHCHDDLGLGVANSLAAVEEGAVQIECAVNGIGERAGNAALEEIALALHTRRDYYDKDHSLNLQEVHRTSRLVSNLTGMEVQPNKAVVGENAFAHEAGIHQDGVLKERTTYEIMDAETIGLEENKIVMGKHSGRSAFRQKLSELGYDLDDEKLNDAFLRFKELTDRKKEITNLDLEAIVEGQLVQREQILELKKLQVTTGMGISTTTVHMEYRGEKVLESACSEGGPIDATYEAINKVSGHDCRLLLFKIDAITGGKDALGHVTVKLTKSGIDEREEDVYLGRGVSTDIVNASAIAYINATNRILTEQEREGSS